MPRASAENLIKLKKEIELVYGSILQDLIHRIWMNGGQGTYLAPGNDSKRARHDGDSLFVHCSVYDYVKYSNTGLYVTGFDFPPVTDYEKEIYEHYAKLRAEE